MYSYINKIFVAFKCHRSLRPYIKFLKVKLSNRSKKFVDSYDEKINLKEIDPSKLFLENKKLKYDKRGYWKIDPMINLKTLDEYYKSHYWKNFKKGIYHNVNLRDLDHFNLIIKNIKGFSETKKTILNFGSGHLGASFLFYFSGHRVINFDLQPAKTPLINESSDWINVNSLDDIKHEVDFLYSSHSLEHVHSLENFENTFLKMIKNKAHVFFEVPNEKENLVKIDIPHTYYFKKEYFKNLPFIEILCETYSIKDFPNNIDSEGDVIRYLAKKGES